MLTTAIALALTLTTQAAAGFPPAAGTTWGEAVHFGDGTLQTFLTTTESGKPQFFGVRFDASFDSLPDHPGEHGPGYENIVPLPADAAGVIPFDHVSADWNPHGHEPPGIYDIPHFDFHVYLISQEDRLEIAPGDCDGTPLTCDALDRALEPLAESAQPPHHVSVGAVAPFMGDHLLDFRSDEFNGLGFSNTFIFGAWDGAISFFEPMITRAHFESVEEEDCRAIDTPETFATAGHYPTVYCVKYDGSDGSYSVSFEAFEWHDATE